jgi:carbon-monoxide dehydrogenase medium subunit
MNDGAFSEETCPSAQEKKWQCGSLAKPQPRVRISVGADIADGFGHRIWVWWPVETPENPRSSEVRMIASNAPACNRSSHPIASWCMLRYPGWRRSWDRELVRSASEQSFCEEFHLRYIRPTSLEDAVGLLAQAPGKAAVLAGGSDLLVRMKGGFIEPELIIDIKAIDALGHISESDEGFAIGAAVPCAVLGEHAALRQAWPGVVEGATLIGSKQVQGRCTIAGNLCNASPAADGVPALVAAGARVLVRGPAGSRTAPVEAIPVGPGKTSLATGEIIEAILLGKRQPRSGDAYKRFTPRTEMDIAVVSAAVNLTLDDQGIIRSARVALGAAAPTVLLVEEAAGILVGSRLDDGTLDRLAAACAGACRPIDDKRGTVEFRRKVAGVLARRVALAAYQRAEQK